MHSPLALLALCASATAHTIFQELYVNGISQGHLTGIRYPTYDGPITDVSSADIACNGGPNPLTTPYPGTVITVPAGAQVTTEWHHTLTSKGTNDSEDPIDSSHKGPVMAYLAAVSNAATTAHTGLQWFKIYEDGYNPSSGKWAVDTMIANQGKVTFTIPSCIKPGDYLLRAELIALHGAGSYPGAQFYMECAQIRISGGGSASPSTVSLPGAYKGSDPGITLSIYYPPVTNYVIPGPRPFTCSGSDGGSNSTVTSSTPTQSTSTSTPTTTTTTSTAAGPLQTKYGQCGGSGWSGPTQCVNGSTCVSSSQWYSQCL
ncbi:glycosyl hydrolase family 61-domain-containing protein [Auriculariales sp. MPI-PUGE-AT-0066]|nr:glycosyl hydrolase family 61-domain-containing protein [Auriculariales sp. MPI-PUGE-AT-0066]